MIYLEEYFCILIALYFMNISPYYMVEVAPKFTATIKDKNIFRHCKTPHPELKICVIVPAKNEEYSIADTLEALRNQFDNTGKRLDYYKYEVLLLANNCDDKTFEKAKEYSLKYPEFNLNVTSVKLPSKKANIGYVRRILMDEAFTRLSLHGLQNGIIASTDGDTMVDKHWVSNIINEIAMGSDAVGGRILTNTINHDARLYYLRDVTYRLLLAKASSFIDPEKNNPWPCHHQYFGASLAVTCAMYNNCGRLPMVPYLEDMAFFNSLVKVDAKIRCSPFVKVYTSSRMDGRVEIGFSEQLQKWADNTNENVPQMVENVEASLLKLKCKNALRGCFENSTMVIPLKDQLKEIATHLMINHKWLCRELVNATYFGGLWQKTEDAISRGDFYENYSAAHITTAISDLRRFLRNY